MFTLEQIQAAHGRIKSGAEYPRYVAELQGLGVLGYTYFVADGRTEHWGSEGFLLSNAPSSSRTISAALDARAFRDRLVANQKGQTNFGEFCGDCARTGVAQWVADLTAMTCSYYSLDGTLVYVETIPGQDNRFTLAEIDEAHSRTKSGADFPAFIETLHGYGVREFVTYVEDGRSEYRSNSGAILVGPPLYAKKTFTPEVLVDTFVERLSLHQGGGTSFLQFCDDCATTGVDRWVVDLEALTCTYFSPADTVVLVETIPGVPKPE